MRTFKASVSVYHWLWMLEWQILFMKLSDPLLFSNQWLPYISIYIVLMHTVAEIEIHFLWWCYKAYSPQAFRPGVSVFEWLLGYYFKCYCFLTWQRHLRIMLNFLLIMIGSKCSISYFSRYNNSHLKFWKVLLFFLLDIDCQNNGQLTVSSSVAYT